MRFEHVEQFALNWVGDFPLEEVVFDHEEELMMSEYELFCMAYELEHDTSRFDNNCNGLLHASILVSIKTYTCTHTHTHTH